MPPIIVAGPADGGTLLRNGSVFRNRLVPLKKRVNERVSRLDEQNASLAIRAVLGRERDVWPNREALDVWLAVMGA